MTDVIKVVSDNQQWINMALQGMQSGQVRDVVWWYQIPSNKSSHICKPVDEVHVFKKGNPNTPIIYGRYVDCINCTPYDLYCKYQNNTAALGLLNNNATYADFQNLLHSQFGVNIPARLGALVFQINSGSGTPPFHYILNKALQQLWVYDQY